MTTCCRRLASRASCRSTPDVGAGSADPVLQVGEQGTVASAATAVGIAPSAAQVGPPPVTFDRPYLMMVTDPATGEPLFMARVTDPPTR